MRIPDPGWRQVGSGMEKSRIRGKHPRIRNTDIFTFLLQTQVRYGSYASDLIQPDITSI